MSATVYGRGHSREKQLTRVDLPVRRRSVLYVSNRKDEMMFKASIKCDLKQQESLVPILIHDEFNNNHYLGHLLLFCKRFLYNICIFFLDRNQCEVVVYNLTGMIDLAEE